MPLGRVAHAHHDQVAHMHMLCSTHRAQVVRVISQKRAVRSTSSQIPQAGEGFVTQLLLTQNTNAKEIFVMSNWHTEANNTDSDLDRQPWDRTIGMVLADASLSKISDGEFNVSFLTKYGHGRQLAECCRMAIEELAEEPYEGRMSCARVMGRAMELLREIYGHDTPRGWVPVLRKLRETDGSVPSRQQAGDDSERRAARARTLAVDCLGPKLLAASGQCFTGKDREKLGALLEQYSADEIEAAWGEFIAGKDAYQMRFATKNFAEGGGERIILARRQRTSKRKY